MRGRRRRGLQLLAIVILLLALFSLIRLPGELITGFATFGTQEEVMGEVKGFVENFAPITYIGDGASTCLIIDLGFGSSYAFAIERGGNELTITPMTEASCQGRDFTLKFISYEEFHRLAQNPSCGAFLAGGRGEQFWYLPARLWPQGGEPSCNAEFAQKYCPALYYCGEPAELSPALSCCSKDRLDPETAALAATAAQSGIAAQVRGAKSAVIESPLGISSLGGIRAFLAWGLGVLIVVSIILGALLLMRHGKEKADPAAEAALQSIRSYIQMTRSQGFSDSEISHELRNRGWNEDMIEANLKG